MQSNHMERMHMCFSFKLLIEDLRLSSNVAVTVTKKQIIIVKQHISKSGIKPVATKLYGNDAYMIHFQTYSCSPWSLMKNNCYRYKKYIFFLLKFFKYCKEQCCYQTIKEQCIYNSLSDHQTWPLPLLKKSVKNRKLLKKFDSSPLKPFGQMN